jgi:UDP-glucose 4-epimerase
MRIVVTGGAGFIGSHVVSAYLSRGHELLVIDDLSTGKAENLPAGVRLERCDVTDTPRLDRLFRAFRPELVNHHAAQVNLRKSLEDPLFDARINIEGTISVASCAVNHQVGAMIFSSTGGAIYGEHDAHPAAETHPPQPLSPYGVAKLSAEHYLAYFRTVRRLRTVVLRYANVYGPRQDPHGEAGVVSIFFSRMKSGGVPRINGDGEQTRDYIYVGDVAEANMAVSAEGRFNDVFNVGTGAETSVNALLDMMMTASGIRTGAEHGPAIAGEQLRSSIDPGKLMAATGWKPLTALPDGLLATWRHLTEGT